MDIAEQVLRAKEDYDAVYEAGKKAEYDAFWDNYQAFGTRTKCDYMFYCYEWGTHVFWNDSNFYPKYDISPTEASFMFHGIEIEDFNAHLNECGIKVDLSKSNTVRYIFNRARTRKMPEMNFSGVTSSTGLQRAFSYSLIEEIEKLILPSNTTVILTDMFLEANQLAHITIDSVIKNNISFQYSPLTVESMKSVITHLYNYSAENPDTYTVAFNSDCWTALEESGKPFDDGLTDDESFTWQEYVSNDLGWNT